MFQSGGTLRHAAAAATLMAPAPGLIGQPRRDAGAPAAAGGPAGLPTYLQPGRNHRSRAGAPTGRGGSRLPTAADLH